jgi:CheY-like chemotaxis protein
VRVLVVDDDPDSRDLLRRALTLQGADVACAGSAAEAMDAIEDFGPSVLVSDIGMPGEDGYSLLRRLRESGVQPEELRAIAVTAFARADEPEQALAAGYELHLAKPVEVDELAAAVANLAHRGQLKA